MFYSEEVVLPISMQTFYWFLFCFLNFEMSFLLFFKDEITFATVSKLSFTRVLTGQMEGY